MQKQFGKLAVVGAFAMVLGLATVNANAQNPPMSPSPCPSATPQSDLERGSAPMQDCPSPSPDSMMTMAPSSPMPTAARKQ